MSIRVLFWNVNGFTEMMKSAEVTGWLDKNFDICFVSETHMTKGQSFKIQNFKCFNHPYSDVLGSKPRGGMLCMIKESCLQHVNKVDRDTPETIILTLHGGHKIFGLYIPPSDSLYYDDTLFTNISNIFQQNCENRVIIGGGDLNCRVGNIKRTLPLLRAKYRPNVDTFVNSHGKMLEKICNSYKCYVMNNLSIGSKDFDGDFTFYKGNKRSQNDICLSNLVGLEKVEDFSVQRIGWNFSDHLPISVTVSLDLYDSRIPVQASADILTSVNSATRRRASKVKTALVDWSGYGVIARRELELMRTDVEILVEQPDQERLNLVVESLSTKLYTAASTCESKPEIPPSTTAEYTESMVDADRVLHEYSSGLCSWEPWDTSRREAAGLISDMYYSSMIRSWNETLASNDAKKIWEKIDWKGNCNNENVSEEFPELEDLAKQFQSKDAGEDENLLDIDFGDAEVPVLDNEISFEEVNKASTKLKEGKATSDGWVPKMVTEIKDQLFPILLIIFNLILTCRIFPTKWWYAVVIPLFKNKGLRSVAKFFRPVSLVEMLAKLFDFILLNRFMQWFVPHDMQTAYQNGKSSGDHIFFLRGFIEVCNLTKTKIYITAVDFDGAFDRVKRSTLLRKLVAFGASSLFVACLANLYSVSGNYIYDNGASITYMLFSGIKQGLPLSPYLFLFYIDDLFEYLDRIFSGDQSNVFNKLHILIHADDANLIAMTRELMIRKLTSMLEYCKLNSVILQASKCFFLVINGSLEDQKSLQIASEDPITHQNHLEILGSHISGVVKIDLELHFKKRFKNVIKYFNYIRANRIAPVCVKLKVLKSCVASTLLYNCQAFGPNLPAGMNEMYLKMIRAALGVRSNCPNLIVLIEAGCLPLQCLMESRQLNFFRNFRKSLAPNSVRESVFNEMLTKNTKFLNHYCNLNEQYADSDSLTKKYADEIKDTIRRFSSDKDKHYKYWVYMKINPELTASPFLNRIDPIGKAMIKFRLGSHKLKIETGRWNRTPRAERLCNTCCELGDEFHILYNCSEIYRDDLQDMPREISLVWEYDGINRLFQRIREAGYVE